MLGYYVATMETCELDREILIGETSAEQVASVIAHEATHARIHHAGVSAKGQRARIEAVCIRREIAFTSRLPNGARANEQARACLDFIHSDSPGFEALIDGTNNERQVLDRQRLLAEMREADMADWIVRSAERLF